MDTLVPVLWSNQTQLGARNPDGWRKDGITPLLLSPNHRTIHGIIWPLVQQSSSQAALNNGSSNGHFNTQESLEYSNNPATFYVPVTFLTHSLHCKPQWGEWGWYWANFAAFLPHRECWVVLIVGSFASDISGTRISPNIYKKPQFLCNGE